MACAVCFLCIFPALPSSCVEMAGELFPAARSISGPQCEVPFLLCSAGWLHFPRYISVSKTDADTSLYFLLQLDILGFPEFRMLFCQCLQSGQACVQVNCVLLFMELVDAVRCSVEGGRL